jgi:hypothetical protein
MPKPLMTKCTDVWHTLAYQCMLADLSNVNRSGQSMILYTKRNSFLGLFVMHVAFVIAKVDI